MYMLTQQKKLYGEIKDKQNYQIVLQKIAQKVQQEKAVNPQPQKVDKSKELENKIDDFVEKTFQKLNFNHTNAEDQNQPPKNQ